MLYIMAWMRSENAPVVRYGVLVDVEYAETQCCEKPRAVLL